MVGKNTDSESGSLSWKAFFCQTKLNTGAKFYYIQVMEKLSHQLSIHYSFVSSDSMQQRVLVNSLLLFSHRIFISIHGISLFSHGGILFSHGVFLFSHVVFLFKSWSPFFQVMKSFFLIKESLSLKSLIFIEMFMEPQNINTYQKFSFSNCLKTFLKLYLSILFHSLTLYSKTFLLKSYLLAIFSFS